MGWLTKNENVSILGDLLRMQRFSQNNRLIWNRMGMLYSLKKESVVESLIEALEISDLTASNLLQYKSWQEMEKKIHEWIIELKKESEIYFAKCITADPLPLKSRTKLISSLEEVLGRVTEVHCIVNPNIIGGIIIELEGVRFDSSYLSILNDVQKKFTKYMLQEDEDE